MSGGEHTNNNPAQFSKVDEISVGCTNKRVEPNGNEGQCDFDGSKIVSSSFFYSSGEKLPVYSNAVGRGGDVTNWDVSQCFGEGLNSVQTVGEVFDIFGTGFQGSDVLTEQPGMGNNFGNNYAAGRQEQGNDVLTEQMPVIGDESMGREPVEDGGKGTCTDEKIPGNGLGVVGTEIEEPLGNRCRDATNDGDEVSKCRDEGTGGKSLRSREVDYNTLEPTETGGLKSIDEGAKQSAEYVSCIPTECDQNMLSHESETGEPSRVLNGVKCVKNETLTPVGVFMDSVKLDIVIESLNPGDKAVELSSQLHFQKDGPLVDSSKHDHEKHDYPINASNVVSEEIRFDEVSKFQEEGNDVRVTGELIEQIDNATLKAEQDDACKQQTCVIEPVGRSLDDIGKHFGKIVKGGSIAGDDSKASLNEQSRQSLLKACVEGHVIVLGLPATDPSVKLRRFRTPSKVKSRCGRKPRNASKATTSAASSRVLRTKLQVNPSTPASTSSLLNAQGSSRVLRTKLQANPNTPASTSSLLNAQGSSVERRGRKMREMTGKPNDEFSRMRKQLRYLLHKISYERNLLDAYSSEGWRGQSVEKLRPEKELQRAKADINRFRVKIRELFHQMDTISCEGKFPESLYDDEGLIDSEDIFCAKCGSKDLPPGNDIILCDGSCDRGFHQYCLEPPLRTEEIPPGDEGWFCPACDCKFDCIDLLNESQGVKLSIEDSWEKVFPEAVAALAGLKQDDTMGLPSDDSDDNDYNPDGQDDGSKEEGKEINSDESDSDSDESDSSDFSSASEDLGAVRKDDDQYLGLPSDDSEDDDFNPDAANSNDDDDDDDDDDKGASSCSEFASAPEDLGATIGNDEENGNSSPAVLDEDLGDSLPRSGKRHIERLDYKKLFDETYGNAVSDSSDDEEWTDDDDDAAMRRKTGGKQEVSVSANGGKPLVSADGACPAITPRKRGRPKRVQQVEKGSPNQLQKTPQGTSSGGKRGKRPPYNKLPESVTQRLYQSFKENMYPDRSTKEKLAGELGLTPLRVDKWFGNARWSFHHHPSRVEATIARVVPGGGTPQTAASADTNIAVPECGEASSSKMDQGSDEKVSTPQETGKRKAEDNEIQTSKIDTSKDNETQALDSSETAKASGRGRRKKRKSNAGRG